jgi:hypothetical protein
MRLLGVASPRPSFNPTLEVLHVDSPIAAKSKGRQLLALEHPIYRFSTDPEIKRHLRDG